MYVYKERAKIFKAFCDESRLKIINQLQKSELCACNLLETLSISQSTLSHHMKILVESGIVNQRKVGKWVYYGLSDEGIDNAKKLLKEITNKEDDVDIKCECRK